MLVLGRKIGEKVLIGDDIWVMVVGIDGDRVKLGFAAPRGVPIAREELLRFDDARLGTAPGSEPKL